MRTKTLLVAMLVTFSMSAWGDGGGRYDRSTTPIVTIRLKGGMKTKECQLAISWFVGGDAIATHPDTWASYRGKTLTLRQLSDSDRKTLKVGCGTKLFGKYEVTDIRAPK